MSRKRLLQLLGVLLSAPSAITFFVMVVEGIDSPLVRGYQRQRHQGLGTPPGFPSN
jgi:hypothetical protein